MAAPDRGSYDAWREATEALGSVKVETGDSPRGGRIATVCHDNEARLNVIDRESAEALSAAIRQAGRSPDVRVIVLRGAGGRAFIGGADIREMVDLTPETSRSFISAIHGLCAAIRGAPIPVVARLSGYCLGAGLEVAASCDLRVGENQWWLALSDSDAGLWARGHSVGCGLNVKVREPEVYPVQVQGPRSRDVMIALFGDEITKIRYYWTLETELDGIPVVISRTGWSAEIGFEIYLRDPSRGEELWDRIMEAGQPHRIRPIAPSQIRRIEAGIFRYGADLTIEDNPFEIMGLERLVEDQSADYIGKEALMRIKAEGVSRKLVGVVLDGDEPIPGCPDIAPVYRDDEVIGRVTVIVWSPRMQRNIGYVWVPIDLAAPGNALEVTTLTGTATGKTAAVPFFDPGKSVPSQRLASG